MLTLVLGGARSGKSRYAHSLMADAKDVVFIATASSETDPEMEARIERHRAERPPSWVTVEASLDLAGAVRDAEPPDAAVLIDCVTVWVSNLLFVHRDLHREERQESVLGAVRELVEATRGRTVVAVSNEVGGGIVPDAAVGREFRDLQGLANQILAREARRVVLVVAGIPTPLKGTGEG